MVRPGAPTLRIRQTNMDHSIKNKISKIAFLVCLIIAAAGGAFAQTTFDKEEFRARRAKLGERLGDGAAIVFGAESHIYPVKFRQSPDFFYLTGIEEPGSVLVINGPRKASFVFVPKRSPAKIAAEGPGVREMSNAAEFYGISVLPIESFYTYLGAATRGAAKLHLQLTPPDDLQFARSESADEAADRMQNTVFRQEPEILRLVGEVRKWKPGLPAVDVNPLLDELRWVKTPYEIERMRKAGAIAAEALREAMKGTRPGMYEYEIEAAARFVQTKRGARGDAFTPIVASGPNTIVYHYIANNRQMQAGEIVYFDYGADFDYYTSDITRTWPVSGRFTEEQEKWYRCILEARDAIIAAMKPGVSVNDLKKAAEPVYKKHGFLEQYVDGGRYVGHFVGLSVHDPGDEAKPFVPGVVFNVEPVIEFADRKTHLRLEDTILITAAGSENLTAAAPVALEEIYALVRQPAFGVK